VFVSTTRLTHEYMFLLPCSSTPYRPPGLSPGAIFEPLNIYQTRKISRLSGTTKYKQGRIHLLMHGYNYEMPGYARLRGCSKSAIHLPLLLLYPAAFLFVVRSSLPTHGHVTVSLELGSITVVDSPMSVVFQNYLLSPKYECQILPWLELGSSWSHDPGPLQLLFKPLRLPGSDRALYLLYTSKERHRESLFPFRAVHGMR